MQRTNTRTDRLERYLAGRPDLSESDKAELRRAFRAPEHMLIPECQCDPDVWGPNGLERGNGHNPICPNAMPPAAA